MSTETMTDKNSDSKKSQAATAGETSSTAADTATAAAGHTLSFSDIESLEQLRGELTLQAHLLRAELRERFDKTEKDWSILDLHLAPLKTATSKATDDVTAAVRLLFDTVKTGYQDIKNAATSHH